MLTFSITGLESIDKDLTEEKKKIENDVGAALSRVEDGMRQRLKKRITDDFWNAWGPGVAYVRRSDDPYSPGGVAIEDEKAVSTGRTKNEVTLSYEPTVPPGNKGNAKTGDDLIRIIQSDAGWKYRPHEDQLGRGIMPRPFWNNFVEDEEASVLDDLASGMTQFTLEHTKDERIDLSESKLDAGGFTPFSEKFRFDDAVPF